MLQLKRAIANTLALMIIVNNSNLDEIVIDDSMDTIIVTPIKSHSKNNFSKKG